MKNWTNLLFFVASVVFVSVLCVVQGEHQKRDVHRIIIQERIPRPRHPHHHAVHRHGKRSGPRNNKKGSKLNLSSEEAAKSYEDSGSYSLESYEKPEKFTSSKLKKPTKNPYISNPEKTKSDASYQSPKQTLQNDWIPLDNDPVAEHYRTSPVKFRQRKPKNLPNNNPITTYSENNKFPIIQYEPAAIYPLTMFSDNQNSFHLHNLNDFNNPNIKQNVIDLSQLTVVPAVGHIHADFINTPEMQNNEDRLKNHRLTYEVNEPDSNEEEDDMMVSDKTDPEELNEKQHNKRERKNKSHSGTKNGHRRGRSGRGSPHNKEKTKPHYLINSSH